MDTYHAYFEHCEHCKQCWPDGTYMGSVTIENHCAEGRKHLEAFTVEKEGKDGVA